MLKVSIKVKAQAKQDKIEKKDENSYTVWVKAKAVEGKANQAVIKILSEYFDIAKSKVVLVKGKRARDKIFSISTSRR